MFDNNRWIVSTNAMCTIIITKVFVVLAVMYLFVVVRLLSTFTVVETYFKTEKVNMGIAVPLYYKIEQNLKKKIVSGKYKPGDLLPSERELVQAYKVSRLTIRDAINRLVTQGLVEKIQGKGTYVAEPLPNYMVGPLNSFDESFLQSKSTIKTSVIASKRTVASQKISKILNLKELGSDEIFYLEIVRHTNKTPVAYSKCYIPYSHVDGIELMNFTKISLFQTLENYFGLELYEAYDVIDAIQINKKKAALLNLSMGAAVLRSHRKTYLKSGVITEYEEVLYRSDVYKYRNKLVKRGVGVPVMLK
jgi:GntR family transcriptional regulator